MSPTWSLRLLEFDRVREMLLAYCGSDLGRGRVAELGPREDVDWIPRQHQLTDEVRKFFEAGGAFDFSGLSDCRELLKKAQIGGAALEIPELREVLTIADRTDEWRAIALEPPASLDGGWPAIRELSLALADFTLLLRFFHGKILPDGTLDDRASPELARLRREIERQKREIQTSLRSYLRQLAACVGQPNRTRFLHHIKVPTLVMHGLNDPLVNASGGKAIAKAIPGAEFIGFQGMGHDLPRELWPRFADEICALAARADA